MSVKVQLPDGSRVTVNTDDQAAAAGAARRHWQQKQAIKPKTTMQKVDGWFDTAADFVDDTVDNLLPNWGDELRGTGRAARALVSGRDPAAAFREGQRSFRADQRRYDKEHPVLAWGSTLTGQAAGLALPATKALKGASLGQKVGQSAKVGAAYGALAGAGEGAGLDFNRRTTNAVTGALAGAGTGAVLPVAVNRTAAAGRLAREHIPGVDRAASAAGGVLRRLPEVPAGVLRRAAGLPAAPKAPRRQASAVTQRANRQIVQRMNDGHLDAGPGVQGVLSTPQAIGVELERRNQLGVPAIVGDVSPSMRACPSVPWCWSRTDDGPGAT